MKDYEPTKEEINQMIIDIARGIELKDPGDPDPLVHVYKLDPEEFAPDVVGPDGEIIKGEKIKDKEESTGSFSLDDLDKLKKKK